MKTVKSIILVLIISISVQGCSSLNSFNKYSPLKVKTAQMKKEERIKKIKSYRSEVDTKNIKTKGEKIVERVNKTSFGKATNIFPAARIMRFVIKKTYK